MEDKLKAPAFTKRNRKRMKFRRCWYLVKKNIIRYLKSTPRLQIIFTNDEYDENFSDECHCSILPSTCYLLQIESHFPFDKFKQENILMSLVFPEESNLKIETFTFIITGTCNGTSLFCQEIRFNCSPRLERVTYLKNKLQPYFIKDSPVQKCLILLARDLSIFYTLELLQVIMSWFPGGTIPIWGGLMDMLNVCQCCFNKNHCTTEAEMVLMFISSPDMNVFSVTLDETCNNKITIREELTTFKEKVELKLHSIAFMYVSSRRIKNLYMFEIQAFKEIFPNMTLFPIYGEASIGGKNWLELRKTTRSGFSVMEGCNTTLMILTYN